MRIDNIRPIDSDRSFLPGKAWLKAGAMLLVGLLAGNVALGQQVNWLYFPLTNAPSTVTTNFPSSTSLGGISVDGGLGLGAYNATGGLTDFEGAAGIGVNGQATGATAMCLTNGDGETQPANATGNPLGSGANASNYAGAIADPSLANTINNFVVSVWFKQPVKNTSSGADNGAVFLPRLFVLSGAGGNDGTAPDIGVKFQQENELVFSVNATALTTAFSQDFTTNKWYFVAWVYDRTNIYQYTGSDTAAAALQNQVAAANLSVSLGGTPYLIVGNRNVKGMRGFDGWMEDFRLYTNVASAGNNAAFVESIRKAIAPKIPTISGYYPDGTSLLQGTNTFVFTANSSSGFNLTNLDLKLNNVDVSSSCTFVTNGTGSTNVTVYYNGLQQQSINTATMSASDSLGLAGSSSVTFDTFNPTNFIVKAEEFDYSTNGGSGPVSGLFIDNPDYTNVAGDSNSYFGQFYTEGIDAHKGPSTGDNLATDYRYDDGNGDDVQTPLSAGELPSPTRFGGAVVPSHCINNWSSAEWQNYTKTFPSGSYNVYARLSTSSGSTINFDQVTSGQGTASQTLSRLGQFSYTGNGLASWQWVPLRQFGSLAVVNFSGVNTVRATTGGGGAADFFMFVPANSNLPTITSVYPDGQFLFEATNKLTFTVSSSVTTINTANISVTTNGVAVANSSLTFSGGPSVWHVGFPGLQLNSSYAVVIQVTDNNANFADAQLSIDTWNPVFQFEAEDFDFDPTLSQISDVTGNRYIDNAVPTAPAVPATNSYEDQEGDILIDEQGNNTPLNGQSPIELDAANPNAPPFAGASSTNYRTNDPCATTIVTDTPRRQFTAGTLDYNVGFLGPGHWEQYTRTYPSGTFNLYARVASGAGLGTLYSSFSQVITEWGTTNQITKHIGSYGIPSSGGYSSYFYAPLMDRFGNLANLTLGGTNTLRDTHLVFNQTETANGAVYGLNINFYMLLNAATNQARIDAVYPDGTQLQQGTNVLAFVASSPAYGVNTTNIQVTLNGVNVSSGLVFSGGPTTWNVSYPGLQPNSFYTAVITVTDNNGQQHQTTVTFDTFSANNFTWEAEDFDFDTNNSPDPNGTSLRFIDNPVPTSAPATNSYYAQVGDPDIDYSSIFNNDAGTLVYRPYGDTATYENVNNIIPIQVTKDAQRARTANAQLQQDDPYIQDYDIINLLTNAWVNYTHTFPTGNYYVYARLSAGGTTNITLQCAQVTSGAGTMTQTTNVLGYFQAMGNSFGSYQYAPLMTATNGGQHVQVPLSGVETLQVTGDDNENVNFFMLVPPSTVNLTSSISGTNVVLSFPTQSGFSYQVAYKNNLTDPTWTPLGTAVTGNGLTQSVTDNLAQSHRFYVLTSQ